MYFPDALLLQAATDVSARITALEAAAKSAQSAGDNAWMLTSAALVLMMTGPGLALFYGGLVRRKNVLSTMMHSFIMMALVTVIWSLVGYSLVFSEGTPFIGGLKYLLLHGVGADPNSDYAGTIPQSTFMIYQMMFAVITPALATGLRVEPQDEGALDARQQGMVAYNLSHALGFGHEAPREVRQPAGSGRAGAPAPGGEETLVTALIDLETTEVVELRKARCWPPAHGRSC
jgi:hypothetical protein